MKKVIMIIFCSLFVIGQGLAFADPSPSKPSSSSSTTIIDDCPCKNGKVYLPMGPGGGRSEECESAAEQMKKYNKIAEQVAEQVAKAAQKKAEEEADSIIDTLMDCVSVLNTSVLGGLDLSGIAVDKILKAVKEKACKFAKEKTADLWYEALAKATIDIGGKTFNLANLDLLGINLVSTSVGNATKGQKLPISINQSQTVHDAAYKIFRSGSSLGALSGNGSLTGNSIMDEFIKSGLEAVIEGMKK